MQSGISHPSPLLNPSAQAILSRSVLQHTARACLHVRTFCLEGMPRLMLVSLHTGGILLPSCLGPALRETVIHTSSLSLRISHISSSFKRDKEDAIAKWFLEWILSPARNTILHYKYTDSALESALPNIPKWNLPPSSTCLPLLHLLQSAWSILVSAQSSNWWNDSLRQQVTDERERSFEPLTKRNWGEKLDRLLLSCTSACLYFLWKLNCVLLRKQ